MWACLRWSTAAPSSRGRASLREYQAVHRRAKVVYAGGGEYAPTGLILSGPACAAPRRRFGGTVRGSVLPREEGSGRPTLEVARAGAHPVLDASVTVDRTYPPKPQDGFLGRLMRVSPRS